MGEEMIFDSHLHWHHFTEEEKRKNKDIMRKIKLNKMAIPATNPKEWEIIKGHKDKNAFIGIGVHPLFVDNLRDDWFDLMKSIAEQYDFIGEIGLDYYEKNIDKEKQKEVFEKQIELAEQVDIPVILHIRKAYEPVYEIIKNRMIRGVIHSVSASYEQIMPFIKKGFGVGIPATVCNPRAVKIRNVVALLPLDKILIESDAPYQPIWYEKGKRNNVGVLEEIIKSIASIRDEFKEKIENTIYENSQQYFL